MIAGGPVGEFVQMNFSSFPSMALRQDIRRKLSDDVMRLYVAPFRPLDRRGVAVFYPGQILAASDYLAELESHLDLVKDKRTLIFWGLKDPGFPPADLRRVEHALPNHRTTEFPDAGHFFFEDKYPEMIQIVLQQRN